MNFYHFGMAIIFWSAAIVTDAFGYLVGWGSASAVTGVLVLVGIAQMFFAVILKDDKKGK